MSVSVSTRLAVPHAAIVGGLVALLALLAFVPPAEARPFDSRYTRFDYEQCGELDSPEPGVVEMRRCAGPDGIAVTWIAEPDSSEVVPGQAAGDEPLGLSAFFEAGDTVEWRMAKRSGTISTIAAIVRYAHGDAIGRLDRSRLVIYRIEPNGRSCILGTVDGGRPNANAEARQLADRWSGGFVCGVSARR